jgi:hypothetical protein
MLLPEEFDGCEVKAAQDNLMKFSLVGFMEDMGEFNDKLNELLGVKIKIGHENKAQGKQADKLEGFSEQAREKINRLCSLDKQVYDFAFANKN